MHAWHRLHIFIQLVNVLCSIDCVNLTNQTTQWEDTSMSLRVTPSMSLTNVSTTTTMTTTRQDATGWNSPKSFVNEENTIAPTSPTNTLVGDSKTGKSTLTVTTESSREISISRIDESNEEARVFRLDESKTRDLSESDSDNIIDTFDDITTLSKKHRNRILLEDPNVTVCQSVEPSPSASQLNYLWSSTKMMEKNLELSNVTTERPKDEDIQVEDLSIVDTTPYALTVSWKRPNSTVEITYYWVEWYLGKTLEGACKVSNETAIHKIIITSLKTCKTYTVKVKPYMVSEPGTERLVTGKTGLEVNDDTLKLKIANTTTDSLKISWDMPSIDCVAYYLVKVCEGDNCKEANTTETTYTKTDLNPCVTSFFNLTVYGIVGPYGTVNVTGTTDFLKPGRPSPAKTKAGNHSLVVSWEEPTGHTCAESYRVTWSHNGKSKTDNTRKNKMELMGLEACAIYEIVILAVWDGGEGLQEIINSEITAPDATDPPLALEQPSVKKDEISIKWLINTNETNNCASIKLTVECIVEKTLGEGYTSLNGSAVYRIDSGTKNITRDTLIGNLTAFTRYKCHSFTVNLGGRSLERSLPIVAVTLEDVPSAPKLLPGLQSNITNSSIALMWEKPRIIPGKLTNLMIQVIWQYEIHRPSWCNESITGTENITIADGSVTSYVYKSAPKSRYRIKMIASTGAGWGNESEAEEFYTNPGAPSAVTRLRHMMNQSTIDPNILDVTIIWGTPCRANSDNIESFRVIGNGKREGYKDHEFSYIVNFTKNSCNNDTCAIMIDDLREEHTYVIQVATKVSEYDDLGDSAELTIDFPAGIPPLPDVNYTSLISIDPLKARRTTTTATVLLPIFSGTGGMIRCYAIIVSKLGYNNATFGRFKDNSSWPYTASWIESKLKNFVIPYEAVKFCTDCYPSYVADYGRLKAVKFVLGEDTETCLKISSDSDERSYCNGPLNPDTWYHVRMRAFTNGGWRDSIVFTVKTNAEFQVAIVIGTIFGILFLGILTTMMLLVRKCSLQAVLRRFLHSDMPGSPVPTPFTRRKFIAHCQQLADNPGKLSNEYQLLQTLSVDLQMPTNAACLQANRKKNRYTDILPYDFSRVKLEVIDNDPNTDYINASFIKGFTGDEDYIACQGPKEETTYDFWRMIDQYDVKIIIMLTQLVEKNKEKCHQYFPTIRETFTYENMAIRCTSELDYKTYTHRTLVLQKESEKRIIIHLHFKDWPDHDVPEDFDPMINFCQIMRRHMEASRGFVVVHCSAGIGRTGTLIAIDILLQHIKENRKLDVFGTVYRLRHHRINMVQRESQYAYIYNCIKQVLKNPYFSKTYKPPSVNPIFENNSHKKKETSDSNTNLVSSLETLKKSSFSTSVESAEPIYQTSSEMATRTCYPFNALRCAKSTSAIDTRPFQRLIGRYNTHDHPISDIAQNSSETKNSDISFDITDSEGSTTSLYENMQPLLRSKSAHAFGGEDTCVTEKLLEHDTSL